MNRELKFRGLSKTGWEYGLPYFAHGTCEWKITRGNGWQPSYSNPDEVESTEWINVDANTVGQFTGFQDKNGNDIYDSDILTDWTETDEGVIGSKNQVFWNEFTGSWHLDESLKQDQSYSTELWKCLNDFKYEITGNIYQITT